MRTFHALPCALLFCTACTAAEAVRPAWTSDRTHRLLLHVDPVPGLARASDEMVASFDLDFDTYVASHRVNLSSLQVIAYDPATGSVVNWTKNIYATTRGDCPLRFYDAVVPWDYADRIGYAHDNNGEGTPIKQMRGGGRFFNAAGEGRRGRLAWAHAQTGREPSYYAVYFSLLSEGAAAAQAPAGFLGDGSNRCLRESPTFAPVFQGRVEVADLGGDGLFDVILGNATGTILWYENMGKNGAPAFGAPKLLFTEDGAPLDVGWSSAPAAVDWDADGDLDLIVSAEKECFVLFRNTGDARRPKFRREGLVQADGKALRVPKSPCEEDPGNKIYLFDYYAVPQVTDWDGDGDMDLLAGGYITGRIWYYENTAGPNQEPRFAFRGALQADGKDLDTTWCASPCALDLDGDGDLDLVSGSMQMTAGGGDAADPDKFLICFENTGTRAAPRLAMRPFPRQGRFGPGATATPRVVDFNDDGLPDLVVSLNGLLFLLANIGTRSKPLFDANTASTGSSWGNGHIGFRQLVDWNADGWPDLFGGSVVSLNDGSGMPGLFSKTVSLPGLESIVHPSPRGDHWDFRILADMDCDGARDVLIGDHPGSVWYHRNLGSAASPRYDPEGRRLLLESGEPVKVGVPPGNVFAFDILQGARTTLTAADYNRDGRTDLIACDTFGHIRLFLQSPQGGVVFQAPVEVGRLVPTRLVPATIDWNDDGWPDLIAAYASGDVFLFTNAATAGRAEFAQPQPLDLPPCFAEPWPAVGDWNNDGDDDLIIDQYGYTRFVERSFLAHGYREATLIGFEERSTR